MNFVVNEFGIHMTAIIQLKRKWMLDPDSETFFRKEAIPTSFNSNSPPLLFFILASFEHKITSYHLGRAREVSCLVVVLQNPRSSFEKIEEDDVRGTTKAKAKAS
uniref:Uncharacterized protein n=1 Tax=Vespula pensylvanica TaxID=30213 RepID=A0A834K4I1_VESPE|nr:hypothetical protein H0235_015810 [Vespula pensylvanica]